MVTARAFLRSLVLLGAGVDAEAVDQDPRGWPAFGQEAVEQDGLSAGFHGKAESELARGVWGDVGDCEGRGHFATVAGLESVSPADAGG